MGIQSPNHPVWKILMVAVVGAIMVSCMSFLYKNGFSDKDVITILGTLGGIIGVDKLKHSMCSKGNCNVDDTPTDAGE